MKIKTHMNDEFAHFSKHRVPVVPYTVETKHFSVHLEELTEVVEICGSLKCFECRGFETFVNVGVCWAGGGFIHINTLACQEFL